MAKTKEKTDKTDDKQLTKTDKPWLFKKGESGNPDGRPKGSISPITKVKQMFEEDPDLFKAFLAEYMSNPNNAKHIVEMIDGKPKGSDTNINVEKAVIPIYGGLSVQGHNSDKDNIQTQAKD